MTTPHYQTLTCSFPSTPFKRYIKGPSSKTLYEFYPQRTIPPKERLLNRKRRGPKIHQREKKAIIKESTSLHGKEECDQQFLLQSGKENIYLPKKTTSFGPDPKSGLSPMSLPIGKRPPLVTHKISKWYSMGTIEGPRLHSRIKGFNWKVPTPQSHPNHPIFFIPIRPFCLNLQQQVFHSFRLPIIKRPREARSPTTPFAFKVPNICHPCILRNG